ncbi:large subunit ribosomal protein L4 [Desulfacinum infernum DSM 9756]|jgi:large subunit ribosomal protein L4|uniref:Large ribosomal subunit protein uL4 n=1 Tax=Desulfacinum infernum DSM 9756 TaxID=1121391 RepID=A0A1M4VWG8_9BACT|nr:50S ribosomal protein L4 [Desulfacinum infernum]MBC7356997.1 50S ribosomal protein L4 [Desulfacinum sp.]MBZ4658690.1 rplD [Desulfacinum sp.]SHE73309.1 large subunit ribosomal protein L4 [Desulfacinum infernum DSM 9756]
MPTIDIFDMNRQVVGQMELRDDIFAVPVKPHVLHEVVLYQLAKRRAGTAKTKGRSEVSGGGRKPWRQKGTGRARVGTIRSPLWRGGGTVHGPQPRSYEMKVPKKVRKLALKMALSQKLQDRELTVVEQLSLPEIKTKEFAAWMERFELSKPLVVIARQDDVVEKSARNIPTVKVLRSEGLNVYDLLNHRNVVLTKETIAKIEESLGS